MPAAAKKSTAAKKKSTAAKRPLSPWIKFVLSRWCTGKFGNDYGKCLKECGDEWRAAKKSGKSLAIKVPSASAKRMRPKCGAIKRKSTVKPKRRSFSGYESE